MKKIFTLFTLVIAVSVSSFAQIAAWNFTGVTAGGAATMNATTSDANLATPVLSRGAGAVSSAAGANSFRTTGFKNDGIALANTDYFLFTLKANTGFTLSLSSIDAIFNGTNTFSAPPNGVTYQFAYSLDGTTYTFIDVPATLTGVTPPATATPTTMPQLNLSGIGALQNVPATVTVSIKYFASGQTATGGWGFNSPAAAQNGLAIGGTLTPAVVAFSSAGEISAVKSSNKTNLTWNLGCNADRCTYELQRSGNGVAFNAIKTETVTPAQCSAPFSFTDAQPLSGVNYYRVKVTDLDGSSSYSKIVSVRFNGTEPIKVVPTIAVSDVKVYYESASAGNSTWVVYDMSGRVVSKSNANLMKGQNTITINVSNLMKGQYQIVGSTDEGKTDAVKIIKQ